MAVPSVLVVDNGSRSTRVVARLVAEEGFRPVLVTTSAVADPVPAVNAVILTGTDLPVWNSVYGGEIRLIQSSPVPLLGLCGGHQLIGRAYGVDVEPGPAVIGRTRVRIMGSIALFHDVPSEVVLFQRHVYCLPTVPPGFELIATSDTCPVEGIRHLRRELYGMQAHLEFRWHGQQILRRFLSLARQAPTLSWHLDESCLP
jgi:GMP synthase (glutamine-hydrolysing)